MQSIHDQDMTSVQMSEYISTDAVEAHSCVDPLI